MIETLTDKVLWQAHWEAKKAELLQPVPGDIDMHQVFRKFLQDHPAKTALELGGFPGRYSIFLKKYLGIEATFLDYQVNLPFFKKILEVNGLAENDITIIDADLFDYTPAKQYDLVYSLGFIEHFRDVREVIKHHIPFMKTGGSLFIMVPNLRGINGWVQKRIDRPVYDIHNIDCMDVQLLKNTCIELGLKNVEGRYDSGFGIWLFSPEKKSLFVKGFVKALAFAGKVFTRIFPMENKLLSSCIIITAVK